MIHCFQTALHKRCRILIFLQEKFAICESYLVRAKSYVISRKIRKFQDKVNQKLASYLEVSRLANIGSF